MSIIKHEDEQGVSIVDQSTGEVLLFILSYKKQARPHSFNTYVGEDTKYLSECITQEEFNLVFKAMDSYRDKKYVSYQHLTDSVACGLITAQELALLSYMSDRVVGWNYYTGKLSDLAVAAGVKPNHLSRLVDKLSPNLVRVVHRKKVMNDQGVSEWHVVVKVNPVIVWKGDLQYRDNAIRSWYAP